jgi:nucleoside-diphosphate kinase
MAVERTFSILKPDATQRNLTGAINALIEKAGLRIIAQKRVRITRGQAETFYGVHRERPFFGELVEFMTSGPVVVQVLEGEGAIAKDRDVMGAKKKKKAADGTIRKVHAQRKNGEIFPIELSVSESRLGDEVLYTAIIRDVGERLAERVELRKLQRLAQERERLADIGAITAKIVHDLGNPLAALSM